MRRVHFFALVALDGLPRDIKEIIFRKCFFIPSILRIKRTGVTLKIGPTD